MHKKLLQSLVLKRNSSLLIFPIVKMAVKYAKIERVDSLNAWFQKVPLVQIFSNFHNIVMRQQSFEINEQKQEIFYFLIYLFIYFIFFFSKKKKILYYRNCKGHSHFSP